jgi:hypothetical protein
MELAQWRGSLIAETLEKARDERERNRPCGVQIKVFFLGSEFLPLVTGINGYREISKISAIYRAS